MTVMIPDAYIRKETQPAILEWKRVTFGPSAPMRTISRAAEELAELMRAVTSSAPTDKIAEEAADVALILADIGELLGTADWLFGATGPHIYRPVRLTSYALTQLGLLAFDVELITTGADERSQSIALRNLRSVIGSLKELVEGYGRDLGQEIDRKMAVNRARRWDLDGTGHGYHRRAVP